MVFIRLLLLFFRVKLIVLYYSTRNSESIFLRLPTEMIEEVALNAELASVHKLVLVCRRLHPIASRVLYRNPVLYGDDAVLFILAIGSAPTGSLDYVSFVKSLLLYLGRPASIQVLIPALCKALIKMRRLTALRFSMPTSHAKSLGLQMCAEHIIRHLPPDESTIEFSILPTLTRLSLRDGVKLIEIVKFRYITSLKVINPLGPNDVTTMLAGLTGDHGTNFVLQRLVIELWTFTRQGLYQALTSIGESLPAITFLVIYNSYCNALVCSNFIDPT